MSPLAEVVDIADRFSALSSEEAATRIAEFVIQIQRFDAGHADQHASFLMVAGIALVAANQIKRTAR